ncbi:glycan-binding surface protein [Cytophagaceae bacterium YF14B1]|uniref:Glycan-binding surface protein n=2 Tax=Xanthocytophaga flava TaxID=3048013 RepID=A0AAE3QV41_9BACT|nr:glycan-binding surface protein [Xanthocytophaga flavus]
MISLLQSCKDNELNAPVITGVRNYAAAPDDTVLTSLIPGQWVVLEGQNLSGITFVAFNGVPASFNTTMSTQSYAVIQVPSIIPFPSIPADKLNTIQYITTDGTTTFRFDIVAPAPVISSISNENARQGDSVYVFGTNLFMIEKLNFSGAEITQYTTSVQGNYLAFVLPELTESKPVSVTTRSGVYTTPFNVNNVSVNDSTTYILANAEGGSGWEWWGGATLESGDSQSSWPPYNRDFAGNKTSFFTLKYNDLASGAGAEWSHAVRVAEGQWMASQNLADSPDRWAVKFEMNIARSWNGTTLCMKSMNGNYIVRYEPWKTNSSPSGPARSETQGWQTVTIPLSSFRTQEGQGLPVATIGDLIAGTAKSPLQIYVHNYGSAPTGFYGAFDNIRVVKIQ